MIFIANINLCSIFINLCFSQANVALNLQTKQSEPEPAEDDALNRENKLRKTCDTLNSSIVKILKEEKASEVVPNTSSDISAPSTSSSEQKYEKMAKMIDTPNVKSHSQATEAKSEPIIIDEDESEEEIGEIHIVGDKCQ